MRNFAGAPRVKALDTRHRRGATVCCRFCGRWPGGTDRKEARVRIRHVALDPLGYACMGWIHGGGGSMAAIRSSTVDAPGEVRGATGSQAERERGSQSLFGSLALSYVAAVILLAGLVWAGGLWNLLGNTRLLALFY